MILMLLQAYIVLYMTNKWIKEIRYIYRSRPDYRYNVIILSNE